MTRGFLDRPDCRRLLRDRRLGAGAHFRARARRQLHELVAAGAAFPRPLHLRDLLAPRLLAFQRAGRRSRSAIVRRGPRGAGRSSRRDRRAHRGAIDGRLGRARLCIREPGARARAGARLDRRLDGVAGLPVSDAGSRCALARRKRQGQRRFVRARHPSGRRRAHGARAARAELSLSRDRCAQRRSRQDRAARAPDVGAAPSGGATAHAEYPDALAHRRGGSGVSAVRRRCAEHADAECARRIRAGGRATRSISSAPRSSIGWWTSF